MWDISRDFPGTLSALVVDSLLNCKERYLIAFPFDNTSFEPVPQRCAMITAFNFFLGRDNINLKGGMGPAEKNCRHSSGRPGEWWSRDSRVHRDCPLSHHGLLSEPQSR
jgi:hypothetical protein